MQQQSNTLIFILEKKEFFFWSTFDKQKRNIFFITNYFMKNIRCVLDLEKTNYLLLSQIYEMKQRVESLHLFIYLLTDQII